MILLMICLSSARLNSGCRINIVVEYSARQGLNEYPGKSWIHKVNAVRALVTLGVEAIEEVEYFTLLTYFYVET